MLGNWELAGAGCGIVSRSSTLGTTRPTFEFYCSLDLQESIPTNLHIHHNPEVILKHAQDLRFHRVWLRLFDVSVCIVELVLGEESNHPEEVTHIGAEAAVCRGGE